MKNLIIAALASIVLFSSCEKAPIETSANEILYYSSYESETDLEGYEGYAGIIAEEAPAGAGESSLLIDGGCIVPHLSFQIGPYLEGKNISLSFIAKTDNGGSITLSSNENPSDSENILIQNTEWEDYLKKEIHNLEAGSQLKISFISGGIAASKTWVDQLTLFVETEE